MPQVKKRILIACLFSLCIGNMMMLNVASFLPTFIEGNDWVPADTILDSSDVSLIVSVFSVAQIIFAPFNANIKNYLGSKKTILVGFLLLTTTTFALGAISYI